MPPINYAHVDVFSPRAYSGNSLAVFPNAAGLSPRQMLAITQELRHFETAFITSRDNDRGFTARVFDQFEELPFAGHPLIGAACTLHREIHDAEEIEWSITLADRAVSARTRRSADGYYGLLNQGIAQFLGRPAQAGPFANAFGLDQTDLDHRLPLEVVSTGLRYLIIPVQSRGLDRAKIQEDLGPILATVNAQYAVLFDESRIEIRHWNNDGIIEDVATGSAAGTIGAYCLRHGLTKNFNGQGTAFILNQGRFTGRPSKLRVEPYFDADQKIGVNVGGDVAFVGTGKLETLPV